MGSAQVGILMAEGEAPVAEVMRLALTRQGWQVDVVENVLAPVERADSANAGTARHPARLRG